MRDVRVAVVAAPGVVGGFELAGLSVTEADGPESAGRRLRDLAADPGIGVILVQEDLVDDLQAAEEELGRGGELVLVSFPGPSWAERPEAAREHVARILRRAVGYRVRL